MLIFVPNDAGYAGELDLWEDFRFVYEPPETLRHSYLASFAYARIAREIAGRRYIDKLVGAALAARPKWALALAQIAKGKRLSAARGADFAVVMFPFMYELGDRYPLGAIHSLVAQTSRAHGISYRDLLPVFRGYDYTDLWVHPSDQHPNEKAHGLAAVDIADFLIIPC